MTRLQHFLLATYLLDISGISGQETHVFTGVKVMVSHFHEHELEHEHENGDTDHRMGFLEFICLHYADETHKDSEGHENLPFHHNHKSGMVNYFIAPVTSMVPQPAAALLAVKAHSFFESWLLSPLVYSIWQLPNSSRAAPAINIDLEFYDFHLSI